MEERKRLGKDKGIKMEIPSQYIPILGPISAALIVGIITYVVSVLSKEQKTSEFRQAWIDGLRADIAEFAGHSSSIVGAIAHRARLKMEESKFRDFLFEKESDTIKLNNLLNRIKLRLNPVEHQKLIGLLNDAEKAIGKYIDNYSENYHSIITEIIGESNEILKKEWKRVKRGEPVFRITKWAACLVFVLATVVLCLKIYYIKII